MKPRPIPASPSLPATLTLLLLAGPLQAQLELRPARAQKPAHTTVQPWHEAGLVAVKFRDGLTIRLRAGGLSDEGTGALTAALDVLAGAARGEWQRTHAVSEAELAALGARARARGAREVPDLNLEFRLQLGAGADEEAALDALNALEIVELAWPVARPMRPPSVPDYTANQGYLGAAPGGLGVRPTWPRPGGAGRNVRICDIEYEYGPHIDLPPIQALGAPWVPSPYGSEHATAVLGELFALADGEGTTGMAYRADACHAAALTGAGYNVAAAISAALGTLERGDVILIEQQTAGPYFNPQPCCAVAGSCPPGLCAPLDDCQYGLVPMEWDFSVYNAIQNAVGAGVYVVEAAGNGSQNLDDPAYNALHAPFTALHDSGALLVGAGGSGADRTRQCFSNWGSTLDLQGWGVNVCTTGYGGLHGSYGSPDAYTAAFSGTSSASPMVAAACALLGSMFEAQTDWPMAPKTMRETLRATGLAQTGTATYPATQTIGPRPSLVAAAAELELWRTGDDDEWITMFGAMPPQARRNAALCFDSSRGRMVLFGGDDGLFRQFADTWISVPAPGAPYFDWLQLPVGGPSPRTEAALAYDAKRDRVVLFGGQNFGVDQGDTWEFDPKLQQWSQVSFSGPGPRSGHSLAYDPVRERVVLVGGSCVSCSGCWEWNGTTWTAFAGPSPRTHAGLAYDSDRSCLVLFGGQTSTLVELGETWERSGTSWTLVSTGGPSPRHGTGLAFDTSRRRCLLYGGMQNAPLQLFSDTWEWNGSQWRMATTTFPFAGRANHGLAYDQARGRPIAFGGELAGGAVSSETLLRERHGVLQLGSPYCFGDGTGTPCPCGNAGSSFEGVGCLNSLGLGGKLRSQGQASLFQPVATPILFGSNMPNSLTIYLQGTQQAAGGAGTLFGDGLMCVAGPLIRLASKQNANGASQYPEWMDLPLKDRGGVVEPGLRTYQVWYRNPAAYCTAATFNVTNALQVAWGL